MQNKGNIMKERILGLDITKNSIGWGLIENDPEDDFNNKIIDCGIYQFKAGEIPKTGESPNTPRANARTARNTLKKAKKRKRVIFNLFVENGLFPKVKIEQIFNTKALSNPWELRKRALYEKLSPIDFGKALYHLIKRRGYQFRRAEEMDAKDGESGKLKEGGRALMLALEQSPFLTIGEYLFHQERKTNHPQPNKKNELESVYDRTPHRSLLKQELELIFDKQRYFGNTLATQELQDKFMAIFSFVPEPQSTERLIGLCTFIPNEKRAVRASYSADVHVALTRFINCVIVNNATNSEIKLTELISLDELINLAHAQEVITHSDMRKLLKLSDSQLFKGLKYDTKIKKASKAKANKSLFVENQDEEVIDFTKSEKKVLVEMKAYHEMKRAFGEYFTMISDNDKSTLLNEVAHILTVERGDNARKERLSKTIQPLFKDKTDVIMECLLNTSPKAFKDTHNLSIKALDIIIPQMKEGKRYDESVEIFGKKTQVKSALLPILEKTEIYVNNPIVKRTVSKLVTLVNEIIRYHGPFHKVHIETGKELVTKAEKELIFYGNKEKEQAKKQAEKKIIEFFGESVKPSRKNIDKFRLWESQNEYCLYTGERIPLERLFEDGYTDVDYILPRSRSFDDGFGNMVVCLKQAKILKADKTPFEWFGHDSEKWEAFKSRVSVPSLYGKMGKGKINRLLKENFNEQSAAEYASRRLENSRSYACKVIQELFREYLDMPKSPNGGKIQVQTRNAWLTAELRRQWVGYGKKLEIYNGRYPALNAIIIAFSSQKMIQKLAQHFKWKESPWEKEKPEFDMPYKSFNGDLERLLQYDRTHKDKNGITRNRLLIARAPIKNVTGQAHEVGLIPIRKFKDGIGVAVRKGQAIAPHKSIARVDIFEKDGKTLMLPLYVADMKKPLANKAYKKGVPSDLIDTNDFKFSLFNSDLISIADDEKMLLGYCKTFCKFNLQITIDDFTGKMPHPAITNRNVVKYQATPLGYYYPIKSEKRLPTLVR